MKKLLPLFLLVALPLAAADAYKPTDAERARWTMNDMRSLQTAIEAYATDHKAYPQVNDINALLPLIQPVYIIATPMHDAWGNPYRIESSATTYRIISAGADGKFDPDSWSTPARQLDFTADAVIEHGKMTRAWAYK